MQINAYLYGSTYENYLISLAASFAELIITISFVQYALDRKKKLDARNDELERIKKFHRVLKICIQNYTLYYNQMLTTSDKRSEASLNNFKKNFTISNLSDLYKPTGLLKDNFQVSPVEKFFEIERKIVEICSQILITQDFMFYPRLNIIFQEFLEISLSANNPSGAILGNMKMTIGNKDAKIVLSEMLKSNGDEYYKKILAGETSPSNLLFAYCLLYQFMKKESGIIEQYNEYIEEILSENK